MHTHPDHPDDIIHTRDHGFMTVAAARLFKLDHIVQRFGQWAVTEYGVECLAACYTIPA